MPRGPEARDFAGKVESAVTLMAEAFHRHRIAHALIGGMAVAYRAFPRMTVDVDLIVAGDSLTMGRLVSELVAGGFAPDEREILTQWSEHHLAVLWFGPVRTAWLKPVLPIHRHVVDTAEPLQAFGRPLSVASVEGLILCKLLSDRPADRSDIASLVFTHQGRIDVEYIEREWATAGDLNAPQLIALRRIIENPDLAR